MPTLLISQRYYELWEKELLATQREISDLAFVLLPTQYNDKLVPFSSTPPDLRSPLSQEQLSAIDCAYASEDLQVRGCG